MLRPQATSNKAIRPALGDLALHGLVAPDGNTAARHKTWRLEGAAGLDVAGIWTVQSGIFPKNTASLALHTKAEFRIVGTRERLGRHHGRWHDVVLVERRSPAVS